MFSRVVPFSPLRRLDGSEEDDSAIPFRLLQLLLLPAVPFSTRARFCSPARVIVRPPCRTEYDDDDDDDDDADNDDDGDNDDDDDDDDDDDGDDDNDNDDDDFLLPILTMLSSGGRGLAPGLLAPAGHAVGSGTHGRQRSTCR